MKKTVLLASLGRNTVEDSLLANDIAVVAMPMMYIEEERPPVDRIIYYFGDVTYGEPNKNRLGPIMANLMRDLTLEQPGQVIVCESDGPWWTTEIAKFATARGALWAPDTESILEAITQDVRPVIHSAELES